MPFFLHFCPMHHGLLWSTLALCCPLLPTSAHFGQLFNSFVNFHYSGGTHGEVREGPFILAVLDWFGPILVHFGPLWTTLDHFGPLWTTLDHFGLLWTTLDHFRPLWTTFGQLLTHFFYSIRQHCPGRAPGDARGGLGHTPAHGNGCGNPTKYPGVNSSYPLGSWVLWCQTHPGMYRIKYLHVF